MAGAALPQNVDGALAEFLKAAKDAFADHLASVVLFGSGAEGRLRPTSDVNIILVLTEFARGEIERLAPALNLARAAIRLEAMFLLASEVPAAVECFAQKFADIERRRRVLYGPDPFLNVAPPRAAQIFRLKQVLLNLALRLRESYAERAGREEQLAALVAESAGPLRTCAATLLDLEKGSPPSPKEALELVVQASGNPEWSRALSHISEARKRCPIEAEGLAPTLFSILEISDALRRRAEALA